MLFLMVNEINVNNVIQDSAEKKKRNPLPKSINNSIFGLTPAVTILINKF